MPAVSRVGDTGVGLCPCHDGVVSYTTTIVSGAESVNTNGRNTAIVGSIGIASCGHPTTAYVGSPNVNATKSPVHRIGDTGANCGPYNMVTGSENVNANDLTG